MIKNTVFWWYWCVSSVGDRGSDARDEGFGVTCIV